MKKFIVGIIVSLALLGGLVYFSYPKPDVEQKPLASGAVFVAEHSNFDFGSISMANGKVSHTFKIKNTFSAPIAVTKVSTSCMCTEAVWKANGTNLGPFGMPGHGGYAPRISETIAPGAEAEVEAIFDPAAHGPAGVGLANRSIYIESDGGEPLELTFTATVTP